MGRGHRDHIVPQPGLLNGLLFSDLCLWPAVVRKAQRVMVLLE